MRLGVGSVADDGRPYWKFLYCDLAVCAIFLLESVADKICFLERKGKVTTFVFCRLLLFGRKQTFKERKKEGKKEGKKVEEMFYIVWALRSILTPAIV